MADAAEVAEQMRQDVEEINNDLTTIEEHIKAQALLISAHEERIKDLLATVGNLHKRLVILEAPRLGRI